MTGGVLTSIPSVIGNNDVTRNNIFESIGTTSTTRVLFLAEQITKTNNTGTANTEISLVACVGFVILILTTVGGNTLVILALYLDKRLHSPSFYLIANMAIADVLLGLSVLPFSSVLELLNDRWIFGQAFCSAWLALDVLCCTASIMALMAVSIDRYIGVTRPLNYSGIMTTRRTIYLIIIVWAASILTSVVPLFGLTDREQKSNVLNVGEERTETCTVNKDTFYTIFSSIISFYIPVIILLILYSRVYQEANKQGQKLENEKRRLYQIDYQIASEHIRRKQNQTNGHVKRKSTVDKRLSNPSFQKQRSFSSLSDATRAEPKATRVNSIVVYDENSPPTDPSSPISNNFQLKRNSSHVEQNNRDEDGLNSGLTLAQHFTHAHRSFIRRISSTLTRNSQSTIPRNSNYYSRNHSGTLCANDELLIIKRKLYNLKREKKAFRTLGLILSVLLICWLPFFVTLPVMSILKKYGVIENEDTGKTWFKIAFWLGYCNSALNPFVYAFSNRAIRRAFREVIFRRFCCCDLQCWLCRYFCPNRSNKCNKQQSYQYKRARSNSFTNQLSQISPRRANSFSTGAQRTTPKLVNNYEDKLNTKMKDIQVTNVDVPTVLFPDFIGVVDTDETVAGEMIKANNDSNSKDAENTHSNPN